MANKLPELRKRKKLTQAQLAEKAGVSRSVIARFEAGINQMSPRNLQKVCKVLHCKMDDVLREAN